MNKIPNRLMVDTLSFKNRYAPMSVNNGAE
jgi:hypothetical protein